MISRDFVVQVDQIPAACEAEGAGGRSIRSAVAEFLALLGDRGEEGAKGSGSRGHISHTQPRNCSRAAMAVLKAVSALQGGGTQVEPPPSLPVSFCPSLASALSR